MSKVSKSIILAKNGIRKASAWSGRLASFTLLLFSYSLAVGLNYVTRFIKRGSKTDFRQRFEPIFEMLDKRDQNEISRLNLIDLSLRNMKSKKTRTVITIAGMAVGISVIVFLVSVGYGLQRLVVSRVASLEEMKQADVTTQNSVKNRINDTSLEKFTKIGHVSLVLPMVSAVGRISYQNSITDMAVYGVTTDYLLHSAIRPEKGRLFESNKISLAPVTTVTSGSVAGVSTQDEETIAEKKVNFTVQPGVWVRVRQEANSGAQIIGYTKRIEFPQQGVETKGEAYRDEGQVRDSWVKATVPLWQNDGGTYTPITGNTNQQQSKEGYFAELGVTTSEYHPIEVTPQVLGESTSSATLNDNSAWVEIASVSASEQTQETKTVGLAGNAFKQAVVNQSVLRVLNLKESEAIGKKFSISFVILANLLPDQSEKLVSDPASYQIVGVTPDNKAPIIYVPLADLRSLGVSNYTQVKVVAANQSALSVIRKQIETMGYDTSSVADTVAQINTLFATVRNALMILGLVALFVAALGMLNTLTISLLEKTREVGLMKVMGMKSAKIQELFLTESMIMGFYGGVLGILLGAALGFILSFGLSIMSVTKGFGLVAVAYIPLGMIIGIILLSLVVGLITGIFPAQRATKISALDALRYE
ncbi:ABC transporter permease [Patescibacteria group bacterium]|nr:ABC transporter permease [Patescibacteria group bacterium]